MAPKLGFSREDLPRAQFASRHGAANPLAVLLLGMFLGSIITAWLQGGRVLTQHASSATGRRGLIGPETPPAVDSFPTQTAIINAEAGSERDAAPGWNQAGENCVPAAYPVAGPGSDWYDIKAVPHPADCTVQGFPIERLEPELNFRRPWALGLANEVDDEGAKRVLLPYLRAVHDPRMRTKKRRVLLDLGAGGFGTSTLWFLRHYPLEFTEIHCFELDMSQFKKPSAALEDEPFDLIEEMGSSGQVPGAGKLAIPCRVLKKIKLHTAFIAKTDVPGPLLSDVNITRFILEELKLRREDAVVVKMDIEGAEWDVLLAWLRDPEMPFIVDEIFVELHYRHKTMVSFGWDMFSQTRDDATKLLVNMRSRGFYVHPWP